MEIIAILVIMGILAAFAIPKYLSIVDTSNNQSAKAAIAEIKGRLSACQAKYMMNHGGAPPDSTTLFTYATSNEAYYNATNLANVGNEFNTTVASGKPIVITVSSVQGVNVNVTDTFAAAGD